MTDIDSKSRTIVSYVYHNFISDEGRQRKRNNFYHMWDLTIPLAELEHIGAVVLTPNGESMIEDCYADLLRVDPEYVNSYNHQS